MAEARRLFSRTVAEKYFQDLARWIDTREEEPKAWQRAAGFFDLSMVLTPEETESLRLAIWRLVDDYSRKTSGRPLNHPGARLVQVISTVHLIPSPDRGSRA